MAKKRRIWPNQGMMGRRTKSEIMAGVGDYVSSRHTGHNEWTRVLHDGTRVVRLLYTDILTISPDGLVARLDSGGWITPTTANHLSLALARERFTGFYVYPHARKTKLNYMVLKTPDGEHVRWYDFITILLHEDGYKTISDLEGTS